MIVTTYLNDIIVYKNTGISQFVFYQKLSVSNILDVTDIFVPDNAKRIFIIDNISKKLHIYEYSSKYLFNYI